MLSGQDGCVALLLSWGSPSAGGRYHCAALAIQRAWWRHKTEVRPALHCPAPTTDPSLSPSAAPPPSRDPPPPPAARGPEEVVGCGGAGAECEGVADQEQGPQAAAGTADGTAPSGHPHPVSLEALHQAKAALPEQLCSPPGTTGAVRVGGGGGLAAVQCVTPPPLQGAPGHQPHPAAAGPDHGQHRPAAHRLAALCTHACHVGTPPSLSLPLSPSLSKFLFLYSPSKPAYLIRAARSPPAALFPSGSLLFPPAPRRALIRPAPFSIQIRQAPHHK